MALDIIITEDLKNEGNAREFVNRIQNLRKDSGLNLIDRIDVIMMQNAEMQPSLIQFKDYICREILADSLEFVSELTDGTAIDVNEAQLIVNVLKKS